MSTDSSRIPKRPLPQRPPIEWPVRSGYERHWNNPKNRQQLIENSTSNHQTKQQFDWVNYHAQWQKYYQDYYHNYFLKIYETQKQQAAQATRKKKRARRIHRTSLGLASLCAIILLFAQFNPLFIAAIRQNLVAPEAVPIVIEHSSNNVPKEPKIIIPALGVEARANFEFNSLDDAAYLKALESAVTRYASSIAPGEQGNLVLGGHSGANIFSQGDYKYVFSRLNDLGQGDVILLNYNGYQYRYEVFANRVVKSSQTDVISPSSDYLLTLFTCDPPGVNMARRIIKARQTNPPPQHSSSQPQQPAATQIPALNPTLF